MVKKIAKKRKLGIQGNIIIPKMFRELLNLQPEDYVNVVLEDGKLFIEPVPVKEEN